MSWCDGCTKVFFERWGAIFTLETLMSCLIAGADSMTHWGQCETKRYCVNLINTVKIEPYNLENIFCDIHPLQGKSQKMLGVLFQTKRLFYILHKEKDVFRAVMIIFMCKQWQNDLLINEIHLCRMEIKCFHIKLCGITYA